MLFLEVRGHGSSFKNMSRVRGHGRTRVWSSSRLLGFDRASNDSKWRVSLLIRGRWSRYWPVVEGLDARLSNSTRHEVRGRTPPRGARVEQCILKLSFFFPNFSFFTGLFILWKSIMFLFSRFSRAHIARGVLFLERIKLRQTNSPPHFCFLFLFCTRFSSLPLFFLIKEKQIM